MRASLTGRIRKLNNILVSKIGNSFIFSNNYKDGDIDKIVSIIQDVNYSAICNKQNKNGQRCITRHRWTIYAASNSPTLYIIQ